MVSKVFWSQLPFLYIPLNFSSWVTILSTFSPPSALCIRAVPALFRLLSWHLVRGCALLTEGQWGWGEWFDFLHVAARSWLHEPDSRLHRKYCVYQCHSQRQVPAGSENIHLVTLLVGKINIIPGISRGQRDGCNFYWLSINNKIMFRDSPCL